MSFKIHYPLSTLRSVGFYCTECIPCCQVHLASIYSDLLMLYRDSCCCQNENLLGRENVFFDLLNGYDINFLFVLSVSNYKIIFYVSNW